MNKMVAGRAAIALLPWLLCCAPHAATDDDDNAAANADALPKLSAEQQRAAGIVVAHPVDAELARKDETLGSVLEASELIALAGDVEAAAAVAHAAAAEADRLHGLYRAGAGAALKTLEAAQAEQARTRAQAEATAAKFSAQWRPIAAMNPGARRKLLDAIAAGTVLLLRADLAGRHVIGSLPSRALLDVDGIGVPGTVLGTIAQRGEEAQGVGVLVEVRNAPAGLGPGARVPVALLGAKQSGVLVPRDAVFYDDNGAMVYRQVAAKPGDKATRYNAVPVKLLQIQGDNWLVDGVDNDDNIVVHGAGVLWSLQGIVGHAAGDIDDDE
jgi:hypothetical protein